MKLKWSSILLVGIILLSMLFSGVAYAQDETLPSPGLTPDSPFYFFDKMGKSIGMLLAFNSEAKARKALQYAGERLAEAQSMAAKNKVKETERATGDYEKYMEKLLERITETLQQGRSDNISERVAIAAAKHLEVLERIKERAPEKARKALAHAENVSMNGQVNALRALGEKKPERALDICDNVTERQLEKIRVRATDNVTSADMTGALDYAARIAELQDELMEKAESLGINVTALQQRLANSTANRLDVLSRVYEKAPEKARPAIANAIENSVKKYERTIEKLDDKKVKTAVSVNETIDKIPAELRERIKASTSNRLKITSAESDNGTIKVRITTEKQEQDRERLENKETPRPVTVSANQTREQKETVKPEGNTRNTP